MDKELRMLLLYVNYGFLGGGQGIGVASLAGMLKQHGYKYDFIDTSFILRPPGSRKTLDGHKKTSLDNKVYQTKSLAETIEYFLKKYNPLDYDILLASTVSTTYPATKEFIKAIKEKNPNIFTIVGGIHAAVSPNEVIHDPNVDAICIGEGEEALQELLDCYSRKMPYEHVKNFWFKTGEGIIKNDVRPRVNMDLLPYPDYSIFKEDCFYGAFAGNVYRIIPVEISRGCPFACSYCVNKYLRDLYGGSVNKYHKEQSITIAIEKLVYLKEKYNVEVFKFVDESFGVMSLSYMERFAEEYREKINIPFWCQTSAATLTERKVQLLKNMNCTSVSIGVEHGNEQFRKTVLNKNITDAQVYSSLALLKKYDIRSSAYFMVGLPFETRELVFETIKMYKKLINEYGAAPSGIQCFYPFPGCALYDVCIKNKFISDKADVSNSIFTPALDMPDLSYDEILGLKRTLYAYSVLDEILYPIVKVCEEPNPYTDKILEAISNIYGK